jgi:anti-sigma B factor antagonist
MWLAKRLEKVPPSGNRWRSTRSASARFVPSGWNRGVASSFAKSADIICRARTIIDAGSWYNVSSGSQRKFKSGGETVALKMTDRVVDGVAVVAMEGRIVLGEESTALREKVKSLLASGQKKIVLNMDNVTYIDSSGLGALVAAHTSARAQGAFLKLSHLGSKFQEILQVTKLVTVFDVFPTESAAIASFAK